MFHVKKVNVLSGIVMLHILGFLLKKFSDVSSLDSMFYVEVVSVVVKIFKFRHMHLYKWENSMCTIKTLPL